ncbi:MAG: NADH-dependent [FeFe] hydrogenase, group A6 [Bradymonadales bacterium]|jgi:iron-only hydrogenase group A
MINLKINGKAITAPEGSTILEAAKLGGINIPTLCYLKDVHKVGACRVCAVEVEGARNLQASCIVKAWDGMVVNTNSKRVRDARRVLYGLMVEDHPKECMTCVRNQNCELQELGYTLGTPDCAATKMIPPAQLDISPSITRDTRKCILCRRCVTACNQIQQVGAIFSQNRGYDTKISPAMELPLEDGNCTMCGQCVVVCPTGALTETADVDKVWNALNDPELRVIVQAAPAVRAALGECFDLPVGTRVTAKLAAALRELGFDDVFDTNFGADVTIVEEGTELLSRLKAHLEGDKVVVPMITSCSPGWVKHIEHEFPDQLPHLSSCKSPHCMLGALVKSYYAKKINVDPKKIFTVSVMPCTAKKYESQREVMNVDGIRDVDAVITTRELARMIKSAGIDFVNLPDAEFDYPLGLSSGAADIFGVTGGVMEAALRTAYSIITGNPIPFTNLHIAPIVGFETIKTAEITIKGAKPEYKQFEGITLKIAVTSGLAGANVLLKEIEAGTSPYHFIEVMGCPGGCIAGGGQPRSKDADFREKRAKALYNEDESKKIRASHENPDVQKLYKEYLGEPNGHLAHKLLHTSYTPRGKFNERLKK